MQSTWEEHYKSHNYFHMEPHEFLPAFANKCKSKNLQKVLDLGCGSGADILYLAENGFDVTGVDFSPSAASNAEDLLQSKNLPGKVYVDNLFDKITSFAEAEFEAVIATNSLEYTDVDTFKTAIRQIRDTLISGGLFFLVFSSKESKISLQVEEQFFLDGDELTAIVKPHFNILDMSMDNNDSYVLFLEKK